MHFSKNKNEIKFIVFHILKEYHPKAGPLIPLTLSVCDSSPLQHVQYRQADTDTPAPPVSPSYIPHFSLLILYKVILPPSSSA